MNLLLDNIQRHLCDGNRQICEYMMQVIEVYRCQTEEDLRQVERMRFPDHATTADIVVSTCMMHLYDPVWIERSTPEARAFLLKYEKGLQQAYQDRDYRMAVYYGVVFSLLKEYEFRPVHGLYTLIIDGMTWDLQHWPDCAYEEDPDDEPDDEEL